MQHVNPGEETTEVAGDVPVSPPSTISPKSRPCSRDPSLILARLPQARHSASKASLVNELTNPLRPVCRRPGKDKEHTPIEVFNQLRNVQTILRRNGGPSHSKCACPPSGRRRRRRPLRQPVYHHDDPEAHSNLVHSQILLRSSPAQPPRPPSRRACPPARYKPNLRSRAHRS